MNLNVGKEVAALRRMSVDELRAKYIELFGEEAWTTNNRVWLVKRIAWRMQAMAEGDLSERARQRAAELANDADLRLSPPRPAPIALAPVVRAHPTAGPRKKESHQLRPGTILARKYRGEMLEVRVLAHSFEFEGAIYPSLSAVAKAITGSHCSGHLFFRLTEKGGGRYFRYADDQMILLNDPSVKDELLLLLTRNLDRYGLRVNQKKVDLWTARSLQQHRCRSIQSIFASKGDNQKPVLIKQFVKAYLAIPKDDLQKSWNRGIPLLNRLLWSKLESLPTPYFEKVMKRFHSTEYLLLADHKRLSRVAQLNRKREKPDDLSKILREIGIRTVHNSFHHETRAFALKHKDSKLEILCRRRLHSLTKLMEQARTYAGV